MDSTARATCATPIGQDADEKEMQFIMDEAKVYCPNVRRYIERGDWRSAAILLLAQLKRHDMALQSLTPGGSEYVGDPDRCVAFAKRTRDQYRDMWRDAINRGGVF